MEYAWLWWLGAALLLVTAEIVGGEFVFLMLGLACLVGSGTALATDSIVIQVAVVAVAAVLLLFLVRPWLRHRVMSRVHTPPMGAETYLGQVGTVVEQVGEQTGQVRLPEGTWTARPAVQSEVFDIGQRVRVVRIEGATALVAAEAAES